MIKRIISFSLVLFLIITICGVIAFAQNSPTPISYYSIKTQAKGTGQAFVDKNKVEINSNETVTLAAIETTSDFVFWNITGDWVIVEGNLYEKTLTIIPISDIIAVATFKDGENATIISIVNNNSTSPKTGEDVTPVYLILLMMCIAAGSIMFSSSNIKKMNRKK